VNDIVITKIVEPHQVVVVLAGDDYVAFEVDYRDPDAAKPDEPDAVVFLSPAGAERLSYALVRAVTRAREAS
jgi:hypothetical protein